MKRKTLVETLQRDISRSDDSGPNWPTVLEDAVLEQDVAWILDQQPDITAELVGS